MSDTLVEQLHWRLPPPMSAHARCCSRLGSCSRRFVAGLPNPCGRRKVIFVAGTAAVAVAAVAA
eukprot:14302106-Alexandrium_andersonii.AAC.1